MKKYKIIWSKSAKEDLKNIIFFIKKDSTFLAQEVYNQIKAECQNLYFMPERKRVVPELQALGIVNYRELIYKKWRVIFKISDKSVNVVMVLDARRDIEDLLFQRLLVK